MVSTWLYHEKTGDFPDGGCYNAQPATLLRDWETLDRRYAEIYDHCKDLEKDEIWLPSTLTAEIPDEPLAEAPPQANPLLSRLMGG